MKKYRFPVLLGSTTFILALLAACAANQTSEKTSGAPTVFAREFLPDSRSSSGSYLAGRFAQHEQDWDAAQNYMNAVLDHNSGGDEALMQRTFLLSLGAGNYPKARELASKIISTDGGDDISLVFLACDDMTRSDFSGALAHLDKLPDSGFGHYTKPLLTAWAMIGLGKKDEAMKLLADNSSPDDPTYNMHAGLAAELAGDVKGAEDHYKKAMAGGLTLHSAVLVGNFFTRVGQPEVSKMIYASLAKLYPFNPFISALGRQKSAAMPNITRPADGAGLAMFDLATILYEKHAYDSAQIYGSLVQMLEPQSPFAGLMMGDLAALHGQYAKAVESYGAIGDQSPLYWLSRMRVAEVYEIGGHLDAAIALLTDLTKFDETRTNAYVTIGDMYRRHEDYANALTAYDQAMAQMGAPTQDNWPVVYARGMALERLNHWSLAEKDLLKALEFQPDNPMILNFIGYSWANQGLNMDKALDFIRRAVALKPDDGYILDSYGWAFYKSGRYAEAVKWAEQAVSQVPDDSTILDHLGDIYWQVGRKNEARFKWRRAGELSNDTAFKTQIEGKIRTGVPAAPPATGIVQKEANL